MKKNLGIYIHIPFCVSKCEYCDFYSLAGTESVMGDYEKAVISHIEEAEASILPYEIDSIYFGGGTPSYFGAKRICSIFNALKSSGRVRRDAEVTLEANPDSIKLDELKKLRKEGVNRLSIGMQSSNNEILKIIGRRHNFKQVEMAVETARKAGFENISLDLIYGLPSQSKSDWAETLSRAMELKPEHLSCYGLKLEEGTPMYEKYMGSPMIPDEDIQADMYLYTVDTLAENGYRQYEISNFAIPGYESKHNLKYWELEDYMGFGPSAASCVGNLRYSYVRDLKAYISGVNGDRSIVNEYEKITPMEKASEYIMLGLRTSHGVSANEYRSIYLSEWDPIENLLEEFREKGWAKKEEDRWSFTPAGFLVSNQLINAILEAQATERVQTNPWMRELVEKMPKQQLPKGEDELFQFKFEDNILPTLEDEFNFKINTGEEE